MYETTKLELELVPLGEGMEHPLEYFMDELKTFFEQFGWKVVGEDSEEDEGL